MAIDTVIRYRISKVHWTLATVFQDRGVVDVLGSVHEGIELLKATEVVTVESVWDLLQHTASALSPYAGIRSQVT